MTGTYARTPPTDARITRRALLSPRKLIAQTTSAVDEGAVRRDVESRLRRELPHTQGVLFSCASADASPAPGWLLLSVPGLRQVTIGWILQIRGRGVPVAFSPCAAACCKDLELTVQLADWLMAAPVSCAEPRYEELHLDEPSATSEVLMHCIRACGTHVIRHQASPLGLLELDPDRCTLCGACAIACPAGALELTEGTKVTALEHDPVACTSCGRCVEACPEDALQVERGIDLRRLHDGGSDLLAEPHARCAVCGTQLPPLQMRRRLRDLLPELAGVPLELCAGCAAKASPDHRHQNSSNTTISTTRM